MKYFVSINSVHVKAVFVCMLCDPVLSLSDLLRWSLVCMVTNLCPGHYIEVPVSYHQSPIDPHQTLVNVIYRGGIIYRGALT